MKFIKKKHKGPIVDNDIEMFEDNNSITDGFGNYAPKYCEKCGGEMIVIRPGDIRCSKCDE